MSAALNQLPAAAQEGAGLPRVDTAALDVSSLNCAPAASAAGATFSGRKRRRDGWTADDDAMLRWFCAHHSKWERIAKAMGRTELSVRQRARRAGIKLGEATDAVMPPPKTAYATAARERDAAEHYRSRNIQRTPRKCLGTDCGRMFPSWGIGNRMCEACR